MSQELAGKSVVERYDVIGFNHTPQPMLRQIRDVLEQYRANGGSFTEKVIEDAGHLPFIEKPEEFAKAFHAHIGAHELILL